MCVRVQVCGSVCLCVCDQERKNLRLFVGVCARACVFVRGFVRVRSRNEAIARVCACVYACVCVCACECVRVTMCVCVCL